jgi:uncharacterized protein involved in outer membrane biogenesis
MRRRILAAAVLTLALVVGIALLVRSLIDATYYARILVPHLEGYIGRQIAVGSADIRLWPSPGLRLREVSIAKKPPELGQPFLTVESLRVHARLLPLLARRIAIRHVVIERPTATVTRDEDGRLSLTDLLGGPRRAADERTAKKRAPSPIALSFLEAKMRITGGELSFVDRAAPRRVRTTRVSDINLRAEPRGGGRGPEFDLEATIGRSTGGRNFAVKGELRRMREGWRMTELPLQLDVRTTALDVRPVLPYLPGSWQKQIESGFVTAELSIAGRANRELSLQGKIRVEQADVRGSSYSLVGTVEGEIDGAGGRGGVRGKADLRLAPATFTKGSFIVAGHTGVQATIRAGRGHFRSHIRIDATKANYRHGNVFEKRPGAKLVVEGDLLRAKGGFLVRRALGELGDMAFAGTAEIERPAARGGSTPFALHFQPLEIDLASVPAYVAATVPFALHGRAHVTRVDVFRRPEAPREWQVTSDFRLTDARAAIRLGSGQTHRVEVLAAQVHIEPGLLTAEEGRGVANGVPLTFEGEAKEFMTMLVGDPNRERAEVRFAMRGTNINLDRLLSPTDGALASKSEAVPNPTALQPGGGDRSGEATKQRETRSADVGALAGGRPFLQRFVVDQGEIRASEAIYARRKLTDFRAVLSYDDPMLQLDEARFEAHGGRWHMDGTVTFSDGPSFALGVATEDVVVEDLIASVATSWEPNALRGILDGEVKLLARGNDLADWEKTLEGSGHLTVRKGQMPSFNLMETVTRAVLGALPSIVPGKRDVSFGGHNAFERFEEGFQMHGGRIHTDNLSLLTDDYVLTGQGSLGLDGTVDYATRVALTAKGTQKVIAVAALPIPGSTRIKFPSVPVNVTGRIGAPRIRADVSGISSSAEMLKGMGAATTGAVGRGVKGGAGMIEKGIGRALGQGRNKAADSREDGTRE